MARSAPASIDVVIPVYNEEEVLPLLFERVSEVFSPEARRQHGISRVRCLLVDDGSTDGSARVAAAAIAAGTPAMLFRLSRNFGHQAAVSAGLDQADADVTVVMDCDLQDPPELVPELLARWREGFDVVHAQRRKRKESLPKRFGYWAFYRLVSFLSELDIPPDSGDFSLMDRRVIEAIRSLPEKLRFPRVLRAWVGFRQTVLPYDRPARRAGRTKYGIAKLYRLATDGIASSSIRLLRIAQVFSFSFAILALLLIVVSLVFFFDGQDRTTMLFLAAYVLIAAGNFVVTACLYVLGAYVGRTYLEAKNRPCYLIMETIGRPSPGRGVDP